MKKNLFKNQWEVTEFYDTRGYSQKTIELAKKLMSGGFCMENKVKGVATSYGRLENGKGFEWDQTVIGYDKNMVSIPFFKDYYGKLYVLLNNNYQAPSKSYFQESPRGFAITTSGALETTLQSAVRIIRQKTNLPVQEEQIFRLAGPINPDPSWFNISKGLSFVGCRLLSSWFKRLGNCEYVVNNDFIIDPNKPVPEVVALDEDLLDNFDTNLESKEDPICGLTLCAATLLWRYLYKQQ